MTPKIECTECGFTWIGDNCGHIAAMNANKGEVDREDLALLLGVAEEALKSRKRRGQIQFHGYTLHDLERIVGMYHADGTPR